MMKTPASILADISIANNVRAEYTEDEKVEGVVHAPVFTTRVQMGITEAIGRGRNKKSAKHSAAMQLIEKIIKNNLYEIENKDQVLKSIEEYAHKLTINENQVKTNRSDNQNETLDDENPLTILHELCVKSHWPTPIYKDIGIDGPEHKKMFHMSCTVVNKQLTFNGSASSKQLAKRNAAQIMLNMLRSDGFGQQKDNLNDTNRTEFDTNIIDNFDEHLMPSIEKINDFYDTLPDIMSTKIDELLTMFGLNINFLDDLDKEDEEFDYLNVLEKITELLGCSVIIKCKPQTNVSTESQYIIQIIPVSSNICQKMSVLTVSGSHRELERAKQKAAANCLYVRKM
ncbi:RISC-loading complex subunit tarbp2-like [Oppia nitens]|uniref:RISC-loading complex subunit tarbp2-like n=1 Tax=Oppia nitens TaxID=1686743 RepID=UPI0023DAB5B5|nr:RISC-loading complex subunit tarbp2-like [Oppia nitens]